jgi:hypothetical protein
MKGASYFALGVGLLTETALGQTPSQTLVAQVTGSVPPSGVLITPPPAPVAVPPSGALATIERGVTTTAPFTTPKWHTAHTHARPHKVHWRSASRRKLTTRTTTADQSITTRPEQAGYDGTGYESFFSHFGKGKE